MGGDERTEVYIFNEDFLATSECCDTSIVPSSKSTLSTPLIVSPLRLTPLRVTPLLRLPLLFGNLRVCAMD